MKFLPFIYDYVSVDDYTYIGNILNYSDPKEYLGFNLPFKIKELEDDSSSRWEELIELCDKYIKNHGIQVVDTEETYHNLEKNYSLYDVIFTFEGKYYKINCCNSPFVGPFEWSGYPKEAIEVFPHKTEIVKYY